MTRKDYVKFAALFFGEMAIAKSQRSEVAMLAVRNIILSTADIFAQDNPRFDRARFYKAAGMNL
jgi:hypothetical protein